MFPRLLKACLRELKSVAVGDRKEENLQLRFEGRQSLSMLHREREIAPDGRTYERKGVLSLEPFASVLIKAKSTFKINCTSTSPGFDGQHGCTVYYYYCVHPVLCWISITVKVMGILLSTLFVTVSVTFQTICTVIEEIIYHWNFYLKLLFGFSCLTFFHLPLSVVTLTV